MNILYFLIREKISIINCYCAMLHCKVFRVCHHATATITTTAFVVARSVIGGHRRILIDHNKVNRDQEKVMQFHDE